MSIEQTIFEIVTSVFPSHADIRINQQIGSYQAGISWNVNNDPARPNKKSKTIILKISDEVLQDIPNLSPSEQSRCLGNISRFLQEKLKGFDPDHNIPYGQSAPSETWVITTKVSELTD